MKKPLLKLAIAFMACNFSLSSCHKEDEQPTEVAIEDNSYGMAESEDVLAIAEDAMTENNAGMRISNESQESVTDCGATITVIPKGSNATGKIVVDFGNGQTCADGRTRKGKIIITYTGKYREPGATQLISFDGYSINDNQIEGVKTLTHTKVNQGAYSLYNTHIKVENGKITFKDGKVLVWDSNRVRTYDSKGTLSVMDDEVTVSGETSGISRDNRSFSTRIMTPLLFKKACGKISGHTPVSGIVIMIPQDKPERKIDYGSGSCDKVATLTVNGKSKELALK